MFSKISVTNIVKDHINTLNDSKTGKILQSDVLLFFGTPIIVGILVAVFYGAAGGGLVTIFVTSLSIFAALLFNLLLLVFDAIRKEDNGDQGNKRRQLFLEQIFKNISFCVLVSVLAIVLLMIFGVAGGPRIIGVILSFFIYYLVTLFVLTLFMVLKRTHILISKEFDNVAKG